MLVLGIFAMLLLWVIAPWGIPFVFGTAYQDATKLLIVMSVSIPVLFVASSIGAFLVTTQDHIKKGVQYIGIVAVVNVILNIILIPIFDMMGAAISMIISNISLLTIYYFVAQKLVFPNEINTLKKRN